VIFLEFISFVNAKVMGFWGVLFTLLISFVTVDFPLYLLNGHQGDAKSQGTYSEILCFLNWA